MMIAPFWTLNPLLVAKRLKHLPLMWETWVQSLGREDPLEKEMATHSNILAWRIPWMEGPRGLQSTGSQRVRHDLATSLHFSHLCMTTGKTIAFTVCTFVGIINSLLFNMLPRFLIVFLSRGNCLLISWLQSSYIMTLERKKIKSVTVSIFFPSVCHEMKGMNGVILDFLYVRF